MLDKLMEERITRVRNTVGLILIITVLILWFIAFPFVKITPTLQLNLSLIATAVSGFGALLLQRVLKIKVYDGPNVLSYVAMVLGTVVIGVYVCLLQGSSPLCEILLLLPTLLTAARYGRFAGMVAAVTAFIVAIAIDFWPPNGSLVSGLRSLQFDLPLFMVLFVMGWVVGDLVEAEAKVREVLRNLASRDGLTNLYNYRAFHEILDGQLEAAASSGKELSLILIDLDDFKRYNDVYGHQKGDEILRGFAELLSSSVRTTDIVARYGGEEFAIILPDTPAVASALVAERLRRKMQQISRTWGPIYGHHYLSASLGVGTASAKTNYSKTELIRTTDSALYMAKQREKDRVEIYRGLIEDLRREVEMSDEAGLLMLRTLLAVAVSRDHYTYGHSERVARYAGIFGKALGLSDDEIRWLKLGAFLHDIGKIEIPIELLNKVETLSEEEWAILRNHPEWGASIIEPLGVFEEAIPIVLHHHENYDGTGYPHGLAGDQIPLGARIVAILDVFDALRANRPYREPKPIDEVLLSIREGIGTKFDPELASRFLELVEEGIIPVSFFSAS